MASVLESIVFDPPRFREELEAFGELLKFKANLSERDDIQPFFKKSKHLTAYLGTFALNIAVATEICFEYDFFGDFKADILLGSKQEKEFCVVEFEDGKQDSIFKKRPKRKNPEWSPRFRNTALARSRIGSTISKISRTREPSQPHSVRAKSTLPPCWSWDGARVWTTPRGAD